MALVGVHKRRVFAYGEHEQNMNTPSEMTLVRAAMNSLQDLGVDGNVEPQRRQEIDGVVTLTRDGTTIRYAFQVKRPVTPSLVGALSMAFEGTSGKRLLITDYVTPPLADELRRRNIQFVDAAGNAYLDRRGMLIFVSGRRARGARAGHKTLRAFRGAGLRVGFVLLSVPDMVAAPQRTIASAAGVALGSVAAVFEGFRELGFIAEVRGRRQLLQRERWLDQWTEAYARQLAPALELGRFSGPPSGWWRRADVAKHGAQWGGETAAALLQRHLVPEQAILYSEEMPAALLREHRLKADAAGSIIFRRRFWNAVPSLRPDVVPPLLIYADLVTAGDARSLEGAKEVRDSYLV